MNYILFVIGFFLLIKGASLLVDGASSLAKRFHVSDMLIGLTIIAFGTSMPEFVVSVISSISGNSGGLIIGNVLGSNIANIALVLGVSAIIYPLVFTKKVVFEDIPFGIFAVALFGFFVNNGLFLGIDQQLLSRIDGIILLGFFVMFVRYILQNAKKQKVEISADVKEMSVIKAIVYIILGLIGLTAGGNRIVQGVIGISQILGISESTIGLSIVALGTSLPELATSVIAVIKKKPSIAIGNIIGSNIFNILWILGVSSMIHPIIGNPNMNRDILFTLFISGLLFVFLFVGKRFVLQKYQGLLLVLLYMVYMSILFLCPGG